jgi:DNA-binding helix-hairpin-helix protein with protein kinase domain
MLNQQEADALRRIQNDIGAKVAALNGRIADLNQAETTELIQTLQAKQKQHIADYLRRFSLDRASIRGIGPAFKERLIGSGFVTAADVDYYRVQGVHGIGPTRARSLADWRSSLEAQARRTMPSALSHIEAAAIRANYEGQRRALEQQRDSEVQRQRREEDNIRAQHRPLLEQLDQEEKAANARTQTAISEIRARYAQQYRAIRESDSKLAHDTASKLREIDGKIGEACKKLSGLQWRKEKLRRQLSPYAGIQFPKYVKRVFIGSQAA